MHCGSGPPGLVLKPTIPRRNPHVGKQKSVALLH